MPIKGQSCTISYFAEDVVNGGGKTGDAGNHALRVAADGVSGTIAGSPTEIDSTNLPGWYRVAVAAGENSGDTMVLGGKSSSSGIVVRGAQWTNVVNLKGWLGTTVPTPNVAGYPLVDMAKVAGSVASSFDGTAQGGGSNFITLAASASTRDNAYQYWRVRLVGGTGPDQWGIITSYTGSTRQANIRGSWAVNPDSTTQYDLDPPASADVELYLGTAPGGPPLTGNVTVGGYAVGQDPATIVWAAVSRTITGNVTVGGYAVGQDPGTYVLTTPANKIAANASNQVVASSVAGTVAGSVGSVAGDVSGKVIGGGPGTIAGIGAWAAGAGGSAVMLASSYTAPDNTTVAHLASALTPDGSGGYQFTTLALANAPSGGSGGSTAGQIADAVWTRAGGRTVTGGIVDTATAATSVTNAVTVGTVNDKSGYSLAAAGLDSIAVELGLNLRQAMSINSAALAGVIAGADTSTVTVKGAGVAATRIVATVDATGRPSLTLTPPA